MIEKKNDNRCLVKLISFDNKSMTMKRKNTGRERGWREKNKRKRSRKKRSNDERETI